MAKSTDDSTRDTEDEVSTDASSSDAKDDGGSAKSGTKKDGKGSAKDKDGAKGKATTAKKRRSGDPRKRAEVEDAAAESEKVARHKVKAQKVGNPSWFVPVMLGLMLVGLVWVVTFYITGQEYPVESWGMWNLGAGFALILAGFAMTTRWR